MLLRRGPERSDAATHHYSGRNGVVHYACHPVVAALRSTHHIVREVAMTTLRESIRVNNDEQAQD